jgi:P pilus assembly chaperone PapD
MTRGLLPLFSGIIFFTATTLGAQLTINQLEMTVTPSASARVMATFVVHNSGAQAAQGTLTREDWDRSESGENRFVPSGSSAKSCKELTSFFPTAFRVEPGGDQTVRVAVEKAPGLTKECWDIIFVEAVSTKGLPKNSGLQYIVRTGVKVYIQPAGLKRGASIMKMAVESPGSRLASSPRGSLSPPVKQQIAIRFNNDGEVHLFAKGQIEIRRLDNSVALQIPIAEFPMLSGAVRQLLLDVPDTLLPGTYIALALIEFGGAEIAAGQLELNVR